MNTAIIEISEDGVVQAMHRDGLALGFLGQQQIERASDIRFNEKTQLWDLYVADCGQYKLIAPAEGFTGYEEARKVEVQWLDTCRLQGKHPLSISGRLVLERIRDGENAPLGVFAAQLEG